MCIKQPDEALVLEWANAKEIITFSSNHIFHSCS